MAHKRDGWPPRGRRLALAARSIAYCLAVLATVRSASNCCGEPTGSLELVAESCANNKLDLKSIAEFKQFVGRLREVRQLGAESRQAQTVALAKKQREALDWCLGGAESLLELEQLVDAYDRLRPCKFSEVAKLERFARKHLAGAMSKAPALRFFTLFGVNVGLHCKLNLLAHLRQADLAADPMDFIYSLASPTGWTVLINEQTKKAMKFGGSTHASNQIVHKIARLIPGLSQIEHLDYLNFEHLMDDQEARRRIIGGGGGGGTAKRPGVELGEYQLGDEQLARRTLDSLGQIVESCQNLDQFYVNSILSLAALNGLGLLVGYLNEFHEPSLAQHKWLAAASFCQLMARVRLLSEPADHAPASSTIKFEILHEEQLLESRRQLYSYVAKFDEISERARELVWRASVAGGSWKQRSAAMFHADQGQSVAMRQVRQYFKGVEQNFKLELEEQLQ